MAGAGLEQAAAAASVSATPPSTTPPFSFALPTGGLFAFGGRDPAADAPAADDASLQVLAFR